MEAPTSDPALTETDRLEIDMANFPLQADSAYATCVSRRALLEAMHGEDLHAQDRAKTFERALATYIDARRAHAAVPVDDDEADAASYDRMHAAEAHLMNCTVQTARDLLVKFEIVNRDDVPPADYLALLRQDLMRLAQVDVSPLFLPEEWLNYFRYTGGQVSAVAGELSLSFTGERAAEAFAELSVPERKAVADHLASSVARPPSWSEALAHYRDVAAREEALRTVHNSAERLASGKDDAALKRCEAEWEEALDQRAKAWRALIDTQASTVSELLEKIAVVRADAMLDADAGEGVPVIDAVAADLARIEGRP